MTWELFVGVLTIIYVNFILSGDNAVVIALAVRSLPPRQQKLGIFWGAFGAVALRIVLTYIAVILLEVPALRLGGGLLLVWVAWKLLRESSEDGEHHVKDSANLWEAIWIIIIADLIMSTDNVLAVAAVAKGSLALLIFGLGLSIPIILCCSAVIATLMNKYPWLVILGGAILGKVAGDLIVTDRLIHTRIEPFANAAEWVVPLFLVVGIPIVARWRELIGRLSGRHRPDVVKHTVK